MAQPPPSSEFSRFSTGLYAQEKTPLFQWTKKTTIVVLTVLLVSVFWWYRPALESSEKAEQLFSISKDYSAKQSYELAVQKIDEAIELNPTAGGVVSAPVYYADMKLGRFNLTKTRVAVFPSPKDADKTIDGIIGMDALKNFNVRIDNLKNRLILSTK